MTAVDLFAGPGGWDVAAADLWVDTIGLDTSVDACDTAKAAGHIRHLADVATVDPRDYQGMPGLIASPPCQGFSIAGKGKGRQDAAQLLDGIAAVAAGQDVDQVIGRLHATMTDDRSVLVLEPLRWALTIHPEWIALEQVPGVLPIWSAIAVALTLEGYAVDTGYLHAEAYGVPQTRKRAVLVARLTGPAHLPTPTHSRYHVRTPTVMDPGVLPWVSMAQALGWTTTDLVGFARLHDRGEAVDVDGVAYRARDLRPAGLPSQVVTEKARSWTRRGMLSAGRGNTAQQRERPLDEPSATITGAGSAIWTMEQSAQARGGRCRGWWPTAIAGRGLVQNPGETSNRFNTSTKSRNDGVRVTVQEAATLQTFPTGYPWAGSLTSRFQQVGDAIPPTLARAILAEVMP